MRKKVKHSRAIAILIIVAIFTVLQLKSEFFTITTRLNKVLESSLYTWTGNNFIPPKGVPTFRPEEFLSYFRKRNTLFIGDSTGRRAYGTIFGMMNSSDFSDIDVEELDAVDVIDFNKGYSRKVNCEIQERKIHGYPDENTPVCRNLPFDEPLQSIESDSLQQHAGKSGKFDFLWYRCMKDLYKFFKYDSSALDDYDLVVIHVGIWEAVMKHHCFSHLPIKNKDGEIEDITFSPEEKYNLTLDAITSAASEKLQIVYRTPGWSGEHQGDEDIVNITSVIKEYSDRNISNFVVVDWGSVIAKRSFDGKRIEGDMAPHYGLQARLLYAQQLLHELLLSDHKREGQLQLFPSYLKNFARDAAGEVE